MAANRPSINQSDVGLRADGVAQGDLGTALGAESKAAVKKWYGTLEKCSGVREPDANLERATFWSDCAKDFLEVFVDAAETQGRAEKVCLGWLESREQATEVVERAGKNGGSGLVSKYVDDRERELGSLRRNKDALDECIKALDRGEEMAHTVEAGLQTVSRLTEPLVEKSEKVKASVTEVMRAAVEKVEFVFHYKAQWHRGSAIHIVALFGKEMESASLLTSLLSMRADVEHPCLCPAKKAYNFPIHLAAGCGRQDMLKALVQQRADVNKNNEQWVQEDGRIKQNYGALHEAAFFGQAPAAGTLLELRASIDQLNFSNKTPLRIAVDFGKFRVADLLVRRGAHVDDTLLDSAVKEGKFPTTKLYMIARRSIEDIIRVAKVSSGAADAIMRYNDEDSGCIIHESWRKELRDEAFGMPASVVRERWLALMDLSPRAAADYLDALTATPEAPKKDYYPLPQTAHFASTEVFRWHYKPADGAAPRARPEWSPEAGSTNNSGPKWHCHARKGLAPKGPESLEVYDQNDRLRKIPWLASARRKLQKRMGGQKISTRVEVKVVCIPDILCEEVLDALSRTQDLQIFAKLATQAIIQSAWQSRVIHTYYSHVGYRATELLMLAWWVYAAPSKVDTFAIRCSWTFVAACAVREIVNEGMEMIGCWKLASRRLRRSKTAAENDDHNCIWHAQETFGAFLEDWLTMGNAFDAATTLSLLLLVSLIWLHGFELDSNKELVAFVSLSRWMQLLITLRAFSWVGQKLLPIFQSTAAMGGIFVVTAFTFLGFLHAFYALEDTDKRSRDIFVNAIRFLFIGDGDGIDMVLGFGTGPDGEPSVGAIALLSFSFFLFSLWIMNLFIAGTDQAYEQALEFAHTRFQQERACICLQCFLRPTLNLLPARTYRELVIIVRCLQLLVLAPLWLAMAYIDSLPTIAIAPALAAGIVACEALLLRPETGKTPSQAGAAAPSLARSKSAELPQGSGQRGLSRSLSLPVDASQDDGVTLMPGSVPHPQEEKVEMDRLRLQAPAPASASVPLPRWLPDLAAPANGAPASGGRSPASVARSTASVVRSTSSGEGSAARLSQDAGPRMYLWVCHRADYNEEDYWPGGPSVSSKLEGRVSSLKRDAMMRFRETHKECTQIKKRMDAMDQKLTSTLNGIAELKALLQPPTDNTAAATCGSCSARSPSSSSRWNMVQRASLKSRASASLHAGTAQSRELS